MMGSGKSTLGKNLAQKLNSRFIDLDSEIETKLQKNIEAIFNEFGEFFFRQEESAVLSEVINREAPFVCALGGGAIVNETNLNLIKKSGTLIFIDVKVNELVQRLERGKERRPLLKNLNHAELTLKIEELYQKRYASYSKADFTIENNSNNIDFVTDEIKKRLAAC